MKIVIVYDSVYGNNEKIARAIGKAIPCETKVLRASKAGFSALGEFDVLVVGSPTHGGRATDAVKGFLEKIPKNALKGKGAAAYDTRMSMARRGAVVKGLLKVLGCAAPRIAKELQRKGANIIVEPAGFAVKDREGPLEEGELERASEWAKKLCEK